MDNDTSAVYIEAVLFGVDLSCFQEGFAAHIRSGKEAIRSRTIAERVKGFSWEKAAHESRMVFLNEFIKQVRQTTLDEAYPMDDFTEKHLKAWIEHTYPFDEREDVLEKIKAFLETLDRDDYDEWLHRGWQSVREHLKLL